MQNKKVTYIRVITCYINAAQFSHSFPNSGCDCEIWLYNINLLENNLEGINDCSDYSTKTVDVSCYSREEITRK